MGGREQGDQVMNQKFSIGEALEFGWNTMTGNFGVLMLYMGVPYAVMFILQLLIGAPFEFVKDLKPYKAVTMIPNFIVSTYTTCVLYKVGLRLYDGKPLSFGAICPSADKYWSYVNKAIVVGFKIMLGMFLLLVPGIIWGLQRTFFGIAILDDEAPQEDTIKLSIDITKGQLWQLIMFGLVGSVISLAGFICLIVGVIPASMVTFLAHVHVYKQLMKMSQGTSNRLVQQA